MLRDRNAAEPAWQGVPARGWYTPPILSNTVDTWPFDDIASNRTHGIRGQNLLASSTIVWTTLALLIGRDAGKLPGLAPAPFQIEIDYRPEQKAVGTFEATGRGAR